MKRTFNFASRNIKELVRDPLGAVFAILLPLFLLFVFRQFDIPNEAYLPENFTPGIIVFAFSFLTLFESTLISRDRTTALMTRLSVSPMKRAEYVPGYLLSTLPIALLQCLLITAAGVALGLPMRVRVLLAIPAALPAAVLFALFGVFIGNIVSDKAAPGVSSVMCSLSASRAGCISRRSLWARALPRYATCSPSAPARILSARLYPAAMCFPRRMRQCLPPGSPQLLPPPHSCAKRAYKQRKTPGTAL